MELVLLHLAIDHLLWKDLSVLEEQDIMLISVQGKLCHSPLMCACCVFIYCCDKTSHDNQYIAYVSVA